MWRTLGAHPWLPAAKHVARPPTRTGGQARLRAPRFAIPNGDGTHREVCLDRLEFGADGTIVPVKPTR